MATIYESCGQCGREIMMNVGQSVFDQALMWHVSYCCPYCGEQLEADDRGLPPEDIRSTILAVEGRWQLVVPATGDQKLNTIKVLRARLNLSLNEAIKLKSKMPGVVVIGTKAEVDWLRQALSDSGVTAWIDKDRTPS
ncbi:MAG: hypothetical protein F6J87_25125 [Spirulina sp. SIO3F2]|nr:hypothetical protein [Spirulina sp. SIO3F2]